jgi:hypothetical protein
MSLRYYPISKIKTSLIASSGEFFLNGVPYSGKYYETFDGKFFSGENPVIGKNEPLIKSEQFYKNLPEGDSRLQNSKIIEASSIGKTGNFQKSSQKKQSDEPVSYFPYPLDQDYTRGYIYRYFIKKINQAGYVTEISPVEYVEFQNGTVNYDVSMYLTAQIQWKLTGPLNTKRLSQYDVRAGIVDTNKRLTENLDKTFLGIKAFIGEEYAKWSRPTQ